MFHDAGGGACGDEVLSRVQDRGSQAGTRARSLGGPRDLDVHENVLRNWVREFGSDLIQAFPGHGQVRPEQQKIERLRHEVNKLKAERDILKRAAAFFAKEAIRSSSSLRSTGGFGRWHGCAMRWAYPGRACRRPERPTVGPRCGTCRC
jgi:transposase